ncbi:replication restart DNA helicase PriA [Tamilnaduibacter salinus]|uniref:Replication restart protein PriA n=1 Tax=Tamilnaduibacter salinus TaxID=1484056 RepID=A0A2U1CU46_9GAMM|nr:primosomal protein N' [Tamilnaduibacter salinus]PVY70371.1 replication restart DNA helicase PriA [Tamilnaduibacter salinus]
MTDTARIVLSRPLRQAFDYRIPDGQTVMPGQRVRVRFGRQQLVGLVIATGVTPPEGLSLRPLGPPLEDWAALPDDTRELMSWAARYYQHPLGECLFMALPPALRRGQPASLPTETGWRARPDADPDTLPPQARKQKMLLSWLKQQPDITRESTIRAEGFSLAQIRGLHQRGLIDTATPKPPTPDQAYLDSLPQLTPAQQAAYRHLPSPGAFTTTLLYGITGSGKTELYLHYLQEHLGADQQALILVPEINLTPQTVRRFRRYFGERIQVWHSALNDTERLRTWLSIRRGDPAIVIGTRSAVTLPYADIGAIVVDEEHDSSFKQGEGFRYSGRDLAVVRGQMNDCPVILGSATPSTESFHNARTGKYRLARLEERVGDARPPKMTLLDIRSRPLEGGLARPTLQAIGERIERGEQVLVFVNRRGYAPVMMCFDCGHMMDCPHCDARLTYHRRDRALRCHHCDYQRAAPTTCPECDSEAFRPVGQGTERTEDILEAQFPETPVIRIDRDSTRRRGRIDQLLATVNDGTPCILVGTQMLAKGHDFPNVSLVVAVNADGGLFSVDFRAPETLIQTLLQVSGRAGRHRIPGRVLIQTCHSDHPLLQQLCEADYPDIVDHLLSEREALGLPPFRAMAILRAESRDMADSLAFLDHARQMAARDGLAIWGPLPAIIARRADRHRAQLVLVDERRSRLQRTLAQLCGTLDQSDKPAGLRWQIDVDPIETG